MQSKVKLFCFTFAGGKASFFDDIEKDLPGVEVVKLDYAGHGTRYKEPFYNDFEELADDLFRLIKEKYCGHDYALFGYSMGSISLVEVLKRILKDDEISNPSHVFLAAHEPHTKAELADFSSGELDEMVKLRTIDFGAVPDMLLNNKAFWRVYLPIYRIDYSLIGKYRFEELNLKTQIPCTIFYSETDTPTEDIKQWDNYFIGQSDYHCYEGAHFFIQQHHEEMAEVIRSNLENIK